MEVGGCGGAGTGGSVASRGQQWETVVGGGP